MTFFLRTKRNGRENHFHNDSGKPGGIHTAEKRGRSFRKHSKRLPAGERILQGDDLQIHVVVAPAGRLKTDPESFMKNYRSLRKRLQESKEATPDLSVIMDSAGSDT